MTDNRPELARQFAEALAQHRAGRPDLAEPVYRRMLAADPAHAEAHHLLAVIALQRGDLAAAIEGARRSVDLDARQARPWNTLGAALAQAGRTDEAATAYRRAVEVDPDFAEAWYNLANLLRDGGALAEAETAFRRAIDAQPNHVMALNNLGALWLAGLRLDDAVVVLRQAEAVAPDHPLVLWNLASCLEQLNRIDDARPVVERLLKLAPHEPTSQWMAAKLDRRAKRHAEAAQRLHAILTTARDPALRLNASFELGLALDALDDAAGAFRAFSEGNRRQGELARAGGHDPGRALDRVRRCRAWFTPERLAALAGPPPDDGEAAPIFFVGFPRSGTTLFEQMLAAHPALITTGEDSPLDQMERFLWKGRTHPDDLARFDAAAVRGARAEFWNRARRLLGDGLGGRRLVDKLPLNLVELGVIAKLFPDAQVIVALRDPRDVCLSCFMQQFGANDAMSNFNDLADTARYYAAVMDLWLHYRAHLSLPWIEYRYEDLVEDFEPVARRVLDFLGLPWTEELKNYREKASKRTINTPSYRDVVNPLYKRAAGRWQRYRAQMEPILPILAPYVAAFGYDPS